jgi:lipase ATG15
MYILFLLTFVNGLFTSINYNTVYEMAVMSHNVYYKTTSKNWINTTLDQVVDISLSNDTVKAYFFTNEKRDIGVVSFKGTSLYWNTLDTNNNTKNVLYIKQDTCTIENSISSNDKYNDNLFFSCCFYKKSNLFEKCELCDDTNKHTCCKQCYDISLHFELNYINVVKSIIEKVKSMIDFETSTIIFTGHSLGGILASVSSILYNKKAIAFQTPGDRHYLDLVNNLSNTKYNPNTKYNSNTKYNRNIYHFGHNADPIYMGNCGSTCSALGYYIDTKCHSGYTCLYDAKKKLGYSQSILNHRIEYIIKHVIPKWEQDFPSCVIDDDCVDCEEWVYV